MAPRRIRSSCARRPARCAGSVRITISRSRLACRAGLDHHGGMRAAPIACGFGLLAATGVAAEGGWGEFAWPGTRRLELFSPGFAAAVESETALPPPGGFSTFRL